MMSKRFAPLSWVFVSFEFTSIKTRMWRKRSGGPSGAKGHAARPRAPFSLSRGSTGWPMLRSRWLMVVAAAMFINTSYGTLSYSFSVLVTREAAGGTLGKTAVSIGFAAALLVSGAAALVTGTVADRFGSRRLMASGSLVGG